MATPSIPRTALVLILATASGVIPVPAAAQTGQESTTAALAIFKRAQELVAEGKYDEACPKFEEVLRLEPKAIGTQLQLADCYDHIGKSASAWTTYTLAGDAAASAGQQERADFARGRAEAIKPGVPELTLDIPLAIRSISGVKIERNGIPVRSAQWGLPVPVDPGSYAIVVSAPEHVTWKTSVKLEPGARGVKVAVPPLVAAPSEAQSPDPHPERPGVSQEAGDPPVWAWVVGSVGIGLTGVGVGFAVDGALATCEEAAGKCDPYQYTQADIDEVNDRRHRDLPLAIAFGGAGLVAVTIGIIGLVTAERAPAASTTFVVGPWGSAEGAGLLARGEF